MVIKNGNSPARRKFASSSAVKSRSGLVSKSNSFCSNGKAADKLDGDINNAESSTVESEAGDQILEVEGISENARGDDLRWPTLTAVTLRQPWASLITAGKKHYETRSWATDYRGLIAIHAAKKLNPCRPELLQLLNVESLDDLSAGSIVAIAQLTDVILMTEEFIKEQSAIELQCGIWQIGQFAWKLENVRAIEPIAATGKQGLWQWEHSQNWQKKLFGIDDGIKYLDKSCSWNSADFGDLHHVAEPNGQLNLLDWAEKEPPDPDDYEFREQFDEAYKEWGAQQTALSNQQLTVNSEELCNQSTDGSICVVELASASPMPASNCGACPPTNSVSAMTTATKFSNLDIPIEQSGLISNSLDSTEAQELENQNLLLPRRHAPHFQLTGDGLEQQISETASPTYSEQLGDCGPNSQSLKTSQDCLPVPIPRATNPELISAIFSTPYPRAGTMQNGKLSAAPILQPPGVESELLLLRSPGALSGGENSRPPGKTRLESQLYQLGLIQDGEVVAPEFLEVGYQLPIGWTNPQENRTAIELSEVQSQQLPIDHRSELSAVTEITAIAVQPSEMPWIGESPQLDSNESNISIQLPANIGALTKSELIGMVQEQHQLICVIERKEFELAIEKLHRVRLTGVYLQEFKKRCQHGEFSIQLERIGISVRSAQNYMAIAKNWEIVEAKAKLVSLLSEESQLGLKWALETVRDEKKSLKSAAAPIDPDCWQTPNTSDQPIVDLVRKALGGSIWLDPCSHSNSKIPVSVRYYKDGFDGDGLAESQIWNKTVFINPPFSDPFPWVEKCCFSIARGTCSAAIMLLKSGTLSNVGTGELIKKYASAVCHWRGRIAFLNDEGNVVKGSDFDCIFVYFGDRLDLFRQAFGGRGTISTIDNHYSSVNKKFMLPEFANLEQEQKQLAASVGLSNGRSGVLPDMRDRDRELAERYDPHTVDVLPSISSMPETPSILGETFDERPLATRQFETAKQNCLNDYITAISRNLSAFSDEQISFLAKIINEESAKRIGF